MTAYGNPNARFVLIQMVDDHDLAGMESESKEIRKLTGDDFYLIALKAASWNHRDRKTPAASA